MLNIRELEQRWLRYKIKSYTPYIIIGISILVILSLSVILLSKQESNSSASNIKKVPVKTLKEQEPIKKIKSKKKQETSQKSKVSQTTIKTNQKEKHTHTIVNESKQQAMRKVQLSPSLDFMRKMQDSVQPYYRNDREPDMKENQQKQKRYPQQSSIPTKEQIIKPQVTDNTAGGIDIQRKNTQNDIYEIIQRFEKNNNPVLSLFVAKKYYELGEYREAYDYALKTNNIDKNIEESWIIFAKSLVKLGRRDKAISTLRTYVNYSHSGNARNLLEEIKSGKFK